MSREPSHPTRCTTDACCGLVSRRRFLATTSAAAATLPIVAGPFTRPAQASEGEVRHFVPADKKLSPEWIASLTARGEEKIWSGDELNTLALPIGGIGAGQMYLLGDGSLACWHIYNQTFFTGYGATNYQPKEIPGIRLVQGFALTVKAKSGQAITRKLDKTGFPNVGFIGRYPIGKVLYHDDTLPVEVEMEAFSPFIPLNTLDSTLPATILEFSLRNTCNEPVVVELAGWLENPVGVHSAKAGVLGRRTQEVGRSNAATWIDYAGLPADPAVHKQPAAKGGPFEKQTDFGTVRFAFLDKTDWATADANINADEAATAAVFSNRPDEAACELGEVRLGALGKKLTLAPGQTATVPFVLAWHFPIRRWGYPEFGDVGNYYATRFADAGAVVNYIHKHYERLGAETRLYCKTFYDQSTLPAWLLERIGSTPSILATGTVHWRKNGRFWGWEGVGCCEGTCTHVWNYEHALARLFPELERSMREMQDFGAGFCGSGLVSFRGDSYETPAYAADGQCGTVLKAYREHLQSKDDAFLRRNYDKIKRALHYCMVGDANTRVERSGGSSTSWNTQPVTRTPFDGIMIDRQHNTYDINFYGPNTMVGSLYLAALLAGGRMAEAMGDAEFAAICRQTFAAGRKYSAEKLFNGEYFIQETTDDNRDRDFQYHGGCLSDQLFGQGWARQLGLPDVYPKQQVVSALAAVYKYNWAPDVKAQNEAFAPERWFARPGDAGLFICTWPKTPRPGGDREVRYRDEVWTGIEYQVAGNMIYDGLVTEGLAVIKGLHDRHDGVKHNPYNEVECGDHYARAMAGWGCLLAAAGFVYDGPKGVLGFAPMMQKEDFACFFSGAEGWGRLTQKVSGGARTCGVEVAHGQVGLSQVRLDARGVNMGGAKVSGASGARMNREGDWIVIAFDPKTLKAGDRIEVALPLA